MIEMCNLHCVSIYLIVCVKCSFLTSDSLIFCSYLFTDCSYRAEGTGSTSPSVREVFPAYSGLWSTG